MLRVLIVDNEPVARQGVRDLLRWDLLDCEIVGEAGDGLEACERVSDLRPDIIICDIVMPAMDGLELARRLQTLAPEIAIIMMTGYLDFEYARKAIEYDVAAFVTKPLTVETMIEAVRKAKAKIDRGRSRLALESDLQKQERAAWEWERRSFLQSLAANEETSVLYVLTRCAQLKLNLRDYVVISFAYANEANVRKLKNCFGENEGGRFLLDAFSDYAPQRLPKGLNACLLIVSSCPDLRLNEILTQLCETLQQPGRDRLSCGCSLRQRNPLNLAEGARQAADAQRYAAYSLREGPVYYRDLPQLSPDDQEELFRRIRCLRQALDERQGTEAEAEIDRIADGLLFHRLEPREQLAVFHALYHLIQSAAPLSCAAVSERSFGLPDWEDYPGRTKAEAIRHDLKTLLADVLKPPADGNVEGEAETGGKQAGLEAVLEEVRGYMETHYREELSLEMLAERVHLNGSYLSRQFKKKMGITISGYLQQLRMNEGKRLLDFTDLRIYEVAERCGFSDPVYFSRIFKQYYGVKPLAYRHAQRGESARA